MRFTVLLLAGLLLTPAVIAHHPGSVGGLSAYDPTVAQMVHRLPDVQASFAEWETAYPDLVDLQTIGSSGVLDLPIEAIRITDEAISFEEGATPLGQKLVVYLDGGHHGNEFLGVDLIMYYLEDLLVLGASGDADTQTFLQTHEVWAVPLVNPEGNTLDTRKNANQVDMNRNYGYEWGGPGSGDFAVEPTYRGPEAFSEPEVAANAALAREIQPDLWITTHTGVAEFYWPWGWTFDDSPDHEFFESLEAPFEAATNGAVDAMVAAELYLAAGATDDWGYGQMGVPTHTYEVHDDQNVPIYGEPVADIITNQLAGLDFMVRNTANMGAMLTLSNGPDGVTLTNTGWGRAENVTIQSDGGDSVVPRIEPQEAVVLDASGAVQASWTQLLIDAPEAKTRTTTLASSAPVDGESVDAPAPTLVLLLVGVAVAVILQRRTR